MPDSQVCLDAKTSLEEIRLLKQSFDFAFDQAASSKDPIHIKQAQTLKQDFLTQVANLQETLFPLEAERLFNLKHQYNTQVDLLKRTGLLQTKTEKDPSSDKVQEMLFIKGINNTEYPIPSYQALISRLSERKELFRLKADQGFKKFFLIPFGMSLNEMIEKLKTFLLEYKKVYDQKQASYVPEEPFPLNEAKPVFFVWEEGYKDADRDGALIYNPTSFDKDNHGGKTKSEILAQQEASNDSASGWRFLFCQEGEDGKGIRSIPRAGQGKSEGTEMRREDIEAGRKAQEYLADQQAASPNPDSPYQGESGLTPEDWIMLFMRHLEETGQCLDDWQNDEGSASYLIGAFFSGVDRVLGAGWNRVRVARRVDLFRRGTDYPDESVGVRSVVRG